MKWDMQEVCLWLQDDVGLEEYVPFFAKLQVDGTMLLDIVDSDLQTDLGMANPQHRKQFLEALDAIKTEQVDFDYDGADQDGEHSLVEEDEESDDGDQDEDGSGSSVTDFSTGGSSSSTSSPRLPPARGGLASLAPPPGRGLSKMPLPSLGS